MLHTSGKREHRGGGTRSFVVVFTCTCVFILYSLVSSSRGVAATREAADFPRVSTQLEVMAAPRACAEESVVKGLEDRVEALTLLVKSSMDAAQQEEEAAEARQQEAAALEREDAAAAAAKLLAADSPRSTTNAIMGMSKGIGFPWLYRFVRTAKEAMPTADVVLFTDAASIEGENFTFLLAAFSVTLVLFSEEDLKANQRGFHPSSTRWLLMRDWMTGTGRIGAGRVGAPPYDAVFFCDARDTVFQSDIFSRASARGFYAFQEQRPRTIAECGWNSGWVQDCFGEKGLARVGHNVISCSGTSLASWDDALAYVRLLGHYLDTKPECERNGIDQGIHNWLVYSGELATAVSELHLVTNEEGFIATVQSMPTLTRDRAGRVLNAQREPVAAVHQYDRSPPLLTALEARLTWLSEAETTIYK